MTDRLSLLLSYRRIYNVWSLLEALGVLQDGSEARVKASTHCQHFKNPGTMFSPHIFLAFSKQTLKNNNNKKAEKPKILSI